MERKLPIELAATAWVRSGVDTLEEVGTPAQRKRRDESRIEMGSVIGGRYEVVRFVAEGAFGAVYQAQDLDVAGHVVALKLMHRPPASAEERQMHLREVQLIAAVSHPSVVSFKDYGLHRDRLYIVMPWYEGDTLATRLRDGEPLTRSEARRIFQQLAQALGAIHARGIRHQDVKPENILLARFGEGQEPFPVLLDLGVGAFSHEVVPAFTPAYVAPEMARAHLEMTGGAPRTLVDGKADVFALALTLFDALSPGAREFGGSSSLAALYERADSGVRLPRLPGLHDLDAAFARWLSVDAEERPSALELSRELAVLTQAEERRAERKRTLLRVGPLLSAATLAAVVFGLELRSERVASADKDVRLQAQAAQIEGVRDSLGAVSGFDAAQVEKLLAIAGEKAQLKAQLGAEQERGRELEQAQRTLEAEKEALAKSHVQLLEDHALLARSGERVSQELVKLQGLEAERTEALQASEAELARLRADLDSADEERRALAAELRALKGGARSQRPMALDRGVAQKERKPVLRLEL